MSTHVATETRQALADPRSLTPAVIEDEPGWLTDLRKKALRWVVDHGFPTRKHEDWRYVDLRPLLELRFNLENSRDTDAKRTTALLGASLGGPMLVLVNGRFAPELSSLSDTPGVRIGSAAAAADVRRIWAPDEGIWRDGFDALNTALAVDGAFVEIAPGISLDVPIEVVHLSDATAGPVMSNPRSLILAGHGSRVTIVESYVGTGNGTAFTNASTRVVLAESAELEHCRLQAEGDNTYHLSSLSVRPGNASRFASHLLATGSRTGRHELLVRMTEEDASVDLDGLYVTTGDQCHDNPVRVEHVALNCASSQVFRGIVDGAGHGIFNGHVIVHPGAAGTDAHQVNKNLLLSDHAEVDTRPRLEIFADEVACTHGAAVGQLDPDALFYLRSRGISEPRAKALLVAAFAEEVLDRFQPGPLRDRARALVASRLGTDGRPLSEGCHR